MSHDVDDDAGLASLRAAFRSLPDEEPPPRGLVELMAAARVKADEMAAAHVTPSAVASPPSWWQRMFASLRQPQVLALATLVLVAGGAVFVSQRRDALEASRPAVQESAPAGAIPEADMEPKGGLGRSPERVGAPIVAPAVDPVGDPVVEPAGATVDTPTVAPVDTPTGATVAEPALPAELRTQRPAPKPTKTAKPATRTATSTGAPARPEPTFTGEAEARRVESGSLAAGAAADASVVLTLPQLHMQARTAAERGDCATAKRLAKQIAAQDAAYHRAKLVADPALATCLGR